MSNAGSFTSDFAKASDSAKATSDKPSDKPSDKSDFAQSYGKSSDRPSDKLVSAIMVTRNQEAYLREGIEELMEQSIAGRMEVVVVDAGSEQSEWAVIADLQRKYRDLIALRSADGRGLNLALKVASGKYLTLLEPSDRMKHDAYQKLALALEENPDAMLAYGDTCSTAIPHETFADHTSSGKVIWPDYTIPQFTHLHQVAPHPMWRRELHDSIGFFGVEGEGRIRWLLQQLAGRFRMIHLQEFTGLKLACAARKAGGSVEAPAAPAPTPHAELRPEPASAQAPAEPPTAPGPAPDGISADEAYRALQGVLKGPDLWQASGALKTHLGDYPDHAVAHNDLAAISYQLGEKEKALTHYRIAVQLAPDDSVYRKNLADLLFVEAGEADEAISIYLELLKNAPEDVETLLNLGIMAAQVGQPEEAQSFLQRAIEIEPWNQAVRERLTGLREARGEGREPLEDDEETAEDRYEKVQAMMQRGEAEEAERELEGIVEIYPEFAPAHNDLGVLCYRKGEKEEALRYYEKAAALAPGNSIFQKNLADFYFVEGRDVDGAIAIYLELLRKDPRNVETLMSLGRICTLLDRPREAESFYGKVTELEPSNTDARECLESLAGIGDSGWGLTSESGARG